MERLLDKATVFACCIALLVLTGEVTQGLVALCCTAILVSAAAELANLAGRPSLAIALPLFTCALIVALPQGVVLIPLTAYDLARSSSRLPIIAALIAIVASATSAGAAFASSAPWFSALCLGIASSLLALRTERAALQARQNHRLRDSLQERALALESKNRDLIDRQGYEVELATLSERGRIAREIHDTVGHLLTRANLQVEALRILHQDDARLQSELSGIGATLSEALGAVRQSVHDLHDDSVSLSVQLERVARKVEETGGLAIDLDVSVEDAPAAVASCFVAVTQEALSNTLRHSNAHRVQVRCLEHPAFWQLTVRDCPPSPGEKTSGLGRTFENGLAATSGLSARPKPGVTSTTGLAGAFSPEVAASPFSSAPAKPGVPSSTSPSPGLGLASMRERVESLGGQFRAGREPGAQGFKVFATIPKTPSADRRSA